MKVRTNILIEESVLREAQELGINVSKACENYLKILIQTIKTTNAQIQQQNQTLPTKEGSIGTVGSDKGVLRAGFEPASPARKSKEGDFETIDWKAFEIWLLQSHRERIAKDIVSYAKRYAHCLFQMDLSEVAALRKTLRHHVVSALSNLAKFLGVYEEYKRLLRSYGIDWTGKSVDDLVIERLVKVKDPEEVWQWIRQVKAVRGDLSVFMDFIAITGLRLDEAVQSYNLIIKLHREGKLNQYYNEANECLEHYRFKEVFIRRTKKAFISFVPKTLVEKICYEVPLKSKYAVQKRLKDRGLPVRFSDVREAHNTILTRYLSQPEIDFLVGRVSANIFMANYFNPALIGDLKERIFKAIAEIQTKIS